MLADVHRESVSVALRRLAASRIGALPAPAPAPELPPGRVSVALARRSAPARPGLPARRADAVYEFRNDLPLSISQQRERFGRLRRLPGRAQKARSHRGLWVELVVGGLVLLGVLGSLFFRSGSVLAVTSSPGFVEG